MLVARLLAAGALAYYAGLRLRKHLRHDNPAPQRPSADAQPIEDVLVEDPICRRLIPRKQALTLSDADGILFFCSEDCRNIFQQQQEKKS
ncbi:MAG: hypothetical protein GX087_07055 [Desulfobulbaceae bacterium]|nr:hypothetical protein [Desulfobulbaceae bacterium]